MNRPHRNPVTLACTGLLLVGLTGSVLLARANSQRAMESSDDVLLVSSPKLLQRMSLGYSGLTADIYWTRAVQYFGRLHSQDAKGYKLLAPMLTITTELDPKLNIAYQYGAIFLAQKPPNGAGQPKEAAALLRRGIEQNPDDWRLYYTLGFIYGLEMKDYRAAAQVFAEGARVPNAHPWMRVLSATMAQHGGDPASAHYMWTLMYESATEKMLRENAEKRLRAAEAQMDIAQLQKMVDDYTAETGHAPASLMELVRPGYLFRVPKDPTGRYYRLDANRHVTVQRPEDLPFLELDETTDPLLYVSKNHS
jgi:tetratricopeptide (TPR) repeat protein